MQNLVSMTTSIANMNASAPPPADGGGAWAGWSNGQWADKAEVNNVAPVPAPPSEEEEEEDEEEEAQQRPARVTIDQIDQQGKLAPYIILLNPLVTNLQPRLLPPPGSQIPAPRSKKKTSSTNSSQPKSVDPPMPILDNFRPNPNPNPNSNSNSNPMITTALPPSSDGSSFTPPNPTPYFDPESWNALAPSTVVPFQPLFQGAPDPPPTTWTHPPPVLPQEFLPEASFAASAAAGPAAEVMSTADETVADNVVMEQKSSDKSVELQPFSQSGWEFNWQVPEIPSMDAFSARLPWEEDEKVTTLHSEPEPEPEPPAVTTAVTTDPKSTTPVVHADPLLQPKTTTTSLTALEKEDGTCETTGLATRLGYVDGSLSKTLTCLRGHQRVDRDRAFEWNWDAERVRQLVRAHETQLQVLVDGILKEPMLIKSDADLALLTSLIPPNKRSLVKDILFQIRSRLDQRVLLARPPPPLPPPTTPPPPAPAAAAAVVTEAAAAVVPSLPPVEPIATPVIDRVLAEISSAALSSTTSTPTPSSSAADSSGYSFGLNVNEDETTSAFTPPVSPEPVLGKQAKSAAFTKPPSPPLPLPSSPPPPPASAPAVAVAVVSLETVKSQLVVMQHKLERLSTEAENDQSDQSDGNGKLKTPLEDILEKYPMPCGFLSAGEKLRNLTSAMSSDRRRLPLPPRPKPSPKPLLIGDMTINWGAEWTEEDEKADLARLEKLQEDVRKRRETRAAKQDAETILALSPLASSSFSSSSSSSEEKKSTETAVTFTAAAPILVAAQTVPTEAATTTSSLSSSSSTSTGRIVLQNEKEAVSATSAASAAKDDSIISEGLPKPQVEIKEETAMKNVAAPIESCVGQLIGKVGQDMTTSTTTTAAPAPAVASVTTVDLPVSKGENHDKFETGEGRRYQRPYSRVAAVIATSNWTRADRSRRTVPAVLPPALPTVQEQIQSPPNETSPPMHPQSHPQSQPQPHPQLPQVQEQLAPPPPPQQVPFPLEPTMSATTSATMGASPTSTTMGASPTSATMGASPTSTTMGASPTSATIFEPTTSATMAPHSMSATMLEPTTSTTMAPHSMSATMFEPTMSATMGPPPMHASMPLPIPASLPPGGNLAYPMPYGTVGAANYDVRSHGSRASRSSHGSRRGSSNHNINNIRNRYYQDDYDDYDDYESGEYELYDQRRRPTNMWPSVHSDRNTRGAPRMVEGPRLNRRPRPRHPRDNIRPRPLADLARSNDKDDEDPPGTIRSSDHGPKNGGTLTQIEQKLQKQDELISNQTKLIELLVQQIKPNLPATPATPATSSSSATPSSVPATSVGRQQAEAETLGRNAAQQVLATIHSAAKSARAESASASASNASGSGADQKERQRVETVQINARAQMLVDGIARSMLESVERFENNPQQEVITHAVKAFQQKLQELSRAQNNDPSASSSGVGGLGVGADGDPDSIPPHLLPDLQQAQINEVIQHQREAYLCEREWKQNRNEYVNSHKSSILLFADLVQAVSNLAKPYLQGLGFSNLPGVLEQVIEEPEVKRQLQRAFAMRDDGYVTDPNLYVRTRYLHAILKDLLHKPSQDVLTAGVNVTEAAAHRLTRGGGGGGGPPAASRTTPATTPAVPRSGGRPNSTPRPTTSPAATAPGDLPLRPRVRRNRTTAAATDEKESAAVTPVEKKNDSPIIDLASPPHPPHPAAAVVTTTTTPSSPVEVLDEIGELPELELTEEEKARAEANENQQSDNQLAAVVSSLSQMATRLQKTSASRSTLPAGHETVAESDKRYQQNEAALRQKLAETAKQARNKRF